MNIRTPQLLTLAAGLALALGTGSVSAYASPSLAGDATPSAARPPSDAPAARADADALVPNAPLHGEVTFQPGDWLWEPELAPDGPVVMVVSLPEQRIYVYRNGVRIGVSTVSTGEDGYETPTGEFVILQKERMHHSNLYNDAPMPFMQRLTWDGIALHAGRIPGHPASHGCVRLPEDFARRLFEVTDFGGAVVVADEGSHPKAVVHPGLIAPIEPKTAFMRVGSGVDPADELWATERVTEGPLVAVLSEAERRVVVMRNGIEIASAPLRRGGVRGLFDRVDAMVDAVPAAQAEEGAPTVAPPQEAERVFAESSLDALPDTVPDNIRALLGPDSRILVAALPLDGPNTAATAAPDLPPGTAEERAAAAP
ncbi:L,D-transpeptidase family protein [Coralloluteibacterium stylophorae]|uniref:L,D-transpeptidase family protein n=1 Tax=Coralloluteibacterium stylophorae TaxID=1776034 RepID=A0AAP2FYT9_9GAMM|nr:L,D-transpeptidase family protein [Coralloluteibacterium stylophorae]MBS7457409.1 L,D-transpeptidase family protein [Coralloluteibacterium stylophorae]